MLPSCRSSSSAPPLATCSPSGSSDSQERTGCVAGSGSVSLRLGETGRPLSLVLVVIIEGVITVGLAIIFAFILPNKPATTHWLTPEQREYLVYSLELDQASKDESDTTSVWEGFKMALADPKTWGWVGLNTVLAVDLLAEEKSLLSGTYPHV